MNIAFIGSSRPEARKALGDLIDRYGQSELAEADYVVALGGDGTVLRALHRVLPARRRPVFAMRLDGSLGFLANPFRPDDLELRLRRAVPYSFHPLRIRSQDLAGTSEVFLSVNDASLVRQTRRAARLLVEIDGTACGPVFVGDGMLVATPLGSSAYNRSAGGPILPLQSSLLAVTGIAPFGGRSWTPVAIDDTSVIDLEVVTPAHRPVHLETDAHTAPDIARVQISLARDVIGTLLFDDNPILRSRSPQQPERATLPAGGPALVGNAR
jgi:NAD+ kinase